MSYAPPGPQPTALLSADGRWWWDGLQWRPVAAAAPGWPGWARPYETARTRATFVLAAFAAFLGTLALLTVVDLVAIGMYVMGGGSLGQDQQDLVGLVSLLVDLIYLLSLIVTAVAFSMWMHRAYRNLPALGAQGLRYSPRWAAGAWYIPILNLFRPYQIARELWRASAPAPVAWTLVKVWWAAFLVANLGTNLAARSDFGHGVDQGLDVVSNVLLAGAAVLAMLVVQRITSWQEERARQLT